MHVHSFTKGHVTCFGQACRVYLVTLLTTSTSYNNFFLFKKRRFSVTCKATEPFFSIQGGICKCRNVRTITRMTGKVTSYTDAKTNRVDQGY